MTDGAEHLVVRVQGIAFAVPAASVREVVELAALAPFPESPPHVVGLMNLRGRIVPVVDLAVRMGYARPRYALTDSVVVIERGADVAGFVVRGVEGLARVADDEVEPAPAAALAGEPAERFVRRVARVDGRAVPLLDAAALVFRVDDEPAARAAAGAFPPEEPVFAADATAREVRELRERAERLARPPDDDEREELIPLIVVALGDRRFGLRAESVESVTGLGRVAPIPSAPRHVLGHVSLAGDVVPLVDLAAMLALDGPTAPSGGTVLLVRGERHSTAVRVDAVLEVAHVRPSGIRDAPRLAATRAEARATGSVALGSERVTLVDVAAMLESGAFTVNDGA